MSEKKYLGFVFSLNWKITLASTIFFPVLICLGFWQLSRAEEKQTILEEWYAQQALPTVTVNNLSEIENKNSAIQLQGEFDQTHYWLFENRFFNGKLGYEVLMVFQTRAEEQILVNRGWVPASPYREILPDVRTPENLVSVQGTLKDPTDYNMLQEKGEAHAAWPKRIVEINLQNMSEQYGKTLYAQLLQLNSQSQGAYLVNNEQPVNMTPAKHRAYAFQWFALAFALAVLWLVANSNIIQILKKS